MTQHACHLFLICAAMLVAVDRVHAASPAMADGIKIGELGSDSVMIWTRLTRDAEMNREGEKFPDPVVERREDRVKWIDRLEEMEGSVAGMSGELSIAYWPEHQAEARVETPWVKVDAKSDCSHSFRLDGLKPGTRYVLQAIGRNATGRCSFEGGFRTAPAPDVVVPLSFTVVTGQDYVRRDSPDGHRIYPVMQRMEPDFFVHTGDMEYYDRPSPFADSVALARFKWNRMYALPKLREFHRVTASYFIKDDHDTLMNDCWPGQHYGDLTWQQGVDLFREQVPMSASPYRSFRWGKDAEVWLVEGREFRSNNNQPDGPEKTIWGKAQKQWLREGLAKSDASFRILISPTPILGPDRGNKNDNHANQGFAHEGDEIRALLAGTRNLLLICGDRHWQYVSKDPASGLTEYSCGPTSDAHAGGFSEKQKSPMHQYLKVKGGFLKVAISREDGKPVAVLTHCGVDGDIYHASRVEAQ